MQMYITKNGSKPSASSFKREYCGAIINQKVPKVFEVYRQKRAPARSEGSRRREISVKIQEKQGFLPHKRDNCRICLVDKFGNYHGRGRKIRTLDTRFWRPLLYQLSYTPMVGLRGLEPRTDRL